MNATQEKWGKHLRQIIWNLLLLCAGSAVCAVAVKGILVPQEFANSGITGLAMILHNVFPEINLGLFYILLNAPLFVAAYMNVGKRFFLYSLLGMLIFSLFLAVIDVTIPIHDKILAAMLGGILNGTGAGIMLRSLGSAGGADILSVILLRRHSVRLGSTVLALNIFVLLMTLLVLSLEAVLYTVIVIYVSAKLLNIVVTGFSQRKAVMIISENWRDINKEILTDLRKGVTIIKGMGGYSGREEYILYAVIDFRDLGHLKKTVQHIDPKAFVVVSDTLEVMNQRIGNQPHW